MTRESHYLRMKSAVKTFRRGKSALKSVSAGRKSAENWWHKFCQ